MIVDRFTSCSISCSSPITMTLRFSLANEAKCCWFDSLRNDKTRIAAPSERRQILLICWSCSQKFRRCFLTVHIRSVVTRHFLAQKHRTDMLFNSRSRSLGKHWKQFLFFSRSSSSSSFCRLCCRFLVLILSDRILSINIETETVLIHFSSRSSLFLLHFSKQSLLKAK